MLYLCLLANFLLIVNSMIFKLWKLAGYITKGYPTNVNLVVVEWSKLAAPFYDVAAENSQLVGEKIGYLVNFLVASKFTTAQQVHLAGHSLGEWTIHLYFILTKLWFEYISHIASYINV